MRALSERRVSSAEAGSAKDSAAVLLRATTSASEVRSVTISCLNRRTLKRISAAPAISSVPPVVSRAISISFLRMGTLRSDMAQGLPLTCLASASNRELILSPARSAAS